ncbi:hypothetical protein BEI59_14215 [Eisenbergiella tayi]|jgi:hypothetical protein|uniref:Uncharacterized protein n=1 Tax=Eisenbergiella tayi TaxID=1432052 RepID=A0A1E3UHJ9_9FIRM|nr:hypothetical protein [Eisenbergiella tayi]ODR51397.1 hypothetical protein BEI59_14215 [Eisenbergiella tayi]
MIHTSRQLKALVRNLSKGDSVQAQIILWKARQLCPDTFLHYNTDHPSMLGAMGLLPGDGSWKIRYEDISGFPY